MKKILHLGNTNSTNIGNGALIYGAEKVIAEDIPDVTFDREPWDDYTFELKKFDESFVEMVNKNYDALLINGAVTFNGRHYQPNAGMRFDLPYELWSTFSKPIIFYGVSYRFWEGQTYHHLDKFVKALQYIVESPNILFGVRNDGTKEWLKDFCGIDSSKIHEIPDTGVFVPADESQIYPEIKNGTKNIIIGFNNEDAEFRFGAADAAQAIAMREGYLRNLASAIEQLVERYDANVILAPHYLDDYGMIHEFVSYLKPRVAHQHTVSSGLLKVDHTEYFYGRYTQVDLALSMRVHSMSPSIGLGVPVIPVTSQGRMTDFLDKVGLSDIALDVFDEQLEIKLLEKATQILDDPSNIVALTSKATSDMRTQLKVFNEQMRSILVS